MGKELYLKEIYYWTDNTKITVGKVGDTDKVTISNLNKYKGKGIYHPKTFTLLKPHKKEDLKTLRIGGGEVTDADINWVNDQFKEFCEKLKAYERVKKSAGRRLFELKRKLYRFKHARRI